MMKKNGCADLWKLVMAIGLALLLGACASLRGAPESAEGQTLAKADAAYEEYVKRFFEADDAGRASVRNEYITKSMALADLNHADFRQSIYTERVGSAVGLDLSAMALTATGTVVSGASAKTTLAALATALLGAKASIDKNLYFDRTLPALLSQMDSARAEIRALLFESMKLPASSFSLAEAQAHMASYRDAGSLGGAIKSLTNQAAQADIHATGALRQRLLSEVELTRQLKRDGFVVAKSAKSSSAQVFRKCLRPDQGLDPALKAALDPWFKAEQPAWAKQQKPGALPQSPQPMLSDLLSHPAYETLRQRALADATLKPLIARCAKP